MVLHRRLPVGTGTVVLTLGLAALPDLLQLLPIVGWWLFGSGSFEALRAHVVAAPGQEPALPAVVTLLSHHLHCAAHSAVVAGVLTLLLWKLRGALWLPLLGWWSHIVIDVFTHSADCYASPVLYPLTQRGFDGIAWNRPWFMVLNYLALAGFGLWLFLTRARGPVRPTAQPGLPGAPGGGSDE